MKTMINQMKMRNKPGIRSFGLLLLFGIGSVQAATIGYWRFEGGVAGNDIVTATSEVNSPSMNGGQWSSNEVNVKYGSEVANAYIYDPVAGSYSANAGSMHSPASVSSDDSQILVGDMSVLDGTWTLEMFVKVEDNGGAVDWAASTTNRIFNLDGDERNYATIGATGSGSTVLGFRLDTSEATGDVASHTDYSSNFEDGQWHHLAYVVEYSSGSNTTEIELFVDYASVGGTSATGKFLTNSADDLRFGVSSASNSNFDWFLDEVRLSDSVLDTDDFLQVSAIPEPGSVTLLGLGFLVLLFGLRKCR
ncbi:LamG domain-containing protein [Kiritimatiellaeota bacterium B1221]|nr:LamG domain-containing protein [Kiritimatiellaeota bacterium B1221]